MAENLRLVVAFAVMRLAAVGCVEKAEDVSESREGEAWGECEGDEEGNRVWSGMVALGGGRGMMGRGKGGSGFAVDAE